MLKTLSELSASFFKQIAGFEPVSLAWEAGILTTVLYLHL